MRIERRYTKEGQSAYADIAWRLTVSEIKNPDGSIVFRADDVDEKLGHPSLPITPVQQHYWERPKSTLRGGLNL